MKLNVTNVEVEINRGVGSSVSCELGADRYHFWLPNDVDQLSITQRSAQANVVPILYKNPAHDLKKGDEGYYETRRLKTFSKFCIEMIGKMMEVAEEQNLFTAARQRLEKRAQDERKEREEYLRQERIKEAAPAMFQVLSDISKFFEDNGGSFPLSPSAMISDNDLTIRENILEALKGINAPVAV